MDASYDRKHPMILDGKSALAKLLVLDAHDKTLHGPINMTRVYLRNRFHIIGARVAVRRCTRSCVVCARHAAIAPTQFMGDLPAVILNVARAFQSTGIDYAGPFRLKQGRGKAQAKAYVAVFVCMAYKAVHLELVSDLTTAAFLAALDRFIAVRAGQVQAIYSDNGTNFVGANRELMEAIDSWSGSEVEQHACKSGITWHFNVPINPHAGGLWERAVRSVKHHLNRIGGADSFTYEELATLLARISMCLNSRPLAPMSDDPNDLVALTPGHFIVGGPMLQPIAPDYTAIKENRLSSWQRIHRIQQSFWERWREECIVEQQSRNKWLSAKRNFQKGDFVLLKNSATPPANWLMGRIIRAHAGRDGLVRSAEVRTEHTNFKRPIGQLVLLPVEPHDENEAIEQEERNE